MAVLREALHSLLGNPLRSVLTALSVTFGAAVLLILLCYATGVPETTAGVLRSLGSKEFVVEPRRASPPGGGSRRGRRIQIRYADLPAIREACPSIAAVAPMYEPDRGAPVFTSDKSWPWARVTGVGSEYADVTGLKLVAGRWFSEADEALSESVALISLPLAEGMFEGFSPLGRSVDTLGRRFDVIGVFESNATFAYSLLVPYPTAMEMGEEGGRHVSALAFAPQRPDLARPAIDEMRQALAALYGFDPDDPRALDIEENTDFVEKVEGVSLGLEALVLTIALLALVLGCLGAANVVGIAVAERTSELGLRKALGATAARLRAEVLAETLLLCLAGGALGVALGALAIDLIGTLELAEGALLAPRTDARLLAVSVAVLVITATLAGLPAANRAARLDPVVALREE